MTAPKLSGRALEDYRAFRKAGMPAIQAAPFARHCETVRTFERDCVSAPTYDTHRSAYVHPVEIDGTAYRVEIGQDIHAGHPEENGDCYSPEDVAAWEANEWHYYWVTVTCEIDGCEGFASLGGIDAGPYWQTSSRLDADQQIWSLVLEHGMFGDARDEALSLAREAAERAQASAQAIRRDALEAIASALPDSVPMPHVTRVDVLVALDAAGLRIIRKAHPVENDDSPEPDQDELDYAREDLGPDASEGEVRDVAARRMAEKLRELRHEPTDD